ncbi:MAG: response regulator [Nitrospirae bacterium]|nr:response regulator [Nitrospirota bacterium]
MKMDAHILIVDDMAPMRTIILGNLRNLGFKNIQAVTSAKEAMQVIESKPVDLVLTDWNMPAMSGLELLQWIRQESVNAKFIPVIMITAEVRREQVADAIASGVTNFVLKPFTADILAERIENALTGKNIKSLSSAPAQPKAAQPSQPAPKDGPVSSDNKGRKDECLTILAVDDAPDNLALISNLFQKEYRVKIASNGEKAVKICESDDPPHVVLLDIMMPGMDGYEVMRRLKANATTSEIPVIFITAMDDTESIVKGLGAGAVDYITKPIEPAVVQARVKNFLRYHRGYRELKDTLDTMMENAKLRDDVEHMVRHDIKGPLSSIIGLISKGVTDKRMSPENIKMIEEEAYSILNMISLSTDLYKMETGRFTLSAKPVDIARLILRITEEIHSGFAVKKLSMRNPVNSDVRNAGGVRELRASGDELLCYSLIYNLMKNAAEASPVGGTITTRITYDDMVKIAIHNAGAVPEPIRDRFFEKFVTMGKQGGTGLGTYSARLITEAQNGSIAMQTSDKDGTTIEISLPKWQ